MAEIEEIRERTSTTRLKRKTAYRIDLRESETKRSDLALRVLRDRSWSYYRECSAHPPPHPMIPGQRSSNVGAPLSKMRCIQQIVAAEDPLTAFSD